MNPSNETSTPTEIQRFEIDALTLVHIELAGRELPDNAEAALDSLREIATALREQVRDLAPAAELGAMIVGEGVIVLAWPDKARRDIGLFADFRLKDGTLRYTSSGRLAPGDVS